jgi:hypothetical protein
MYHDQKGLRRHKNADITTKTRHTYPEHVSVSGICSICGRDALCEIGKKAREGRTLFPEPFGTAQFGAEKRLPNLNDIQILPELYGEGSYFVDINTDAAIGGFKCSVPLAIAALGSTKVASGDSETMSAGAGKAGIVRVIGENVYTTFGMNAIKSDISAFKRHQNKKKEGGILVQINAIEGKAGLDEKAISAGADGLELKLGQGAKQCLGGEIRFEDPVAAEKYRKAGFKIIQKGETYERHTHPGNLNEDELRAMLIKYAEHGKPIWAKIAIGRGILKLIAFLDKIKKEQGVPFECLTVDGFGGGTGMSPWLVMNETCLPSPALWGVLEEKPGFDILAAGGFADGLDTAKVMMMGADGVALGRAILIAAKVDKEQGVPNLITAMREELQMAVTILRGKTIKDITNRRENLCALSEEAEKMFGIKRGGCR